MRQAAVIACGAVTLAGAFSLGLYAFRDRTSTPVLASASALSSEPIFRTSSRAGSGTRKPAKAIDQVRYALASSYYESLDPRVLAKPSIGKILKALDDPYTEYLSPPDYLQLQEEVSSRYFGVGLRVGPGDRGLVVTSSFHGPARDAGIKPGDVIVSIDGHETRVLPFGRSLALIKGEEGTKVRLTIRRPGRREPLAFDVVRQQIDIPAVRSRLLRTGGHKLAYVRLLAFSGNAAALVKDATERLVAAGAEGILFDLRGDPGGYLGQGVRVASLFLDKGVVCSTRGANQPEHVFHVQGAPLETKRPLVVLVDHGTGSAAEIVAGALRDHRRAVIVGKRTYGKATVQSIVPLVNGGALKLTTATYRTPSGANIAGKGIKPKIAVADDPLTRPDEAIVRAEKTLLERL